MPNSDICFVICISNIFVFYSEWQCFHLSCRGAGRSGIRAKSEVDRSTAEATAADEKTQHLLSILQLCLTEAKVLVSSRNAKADGAALEEAFYPGDRNDPKSGLASPDTA